MLTVWHVQCRLVHDAREAVLLQYMSYSRLLVCPTVQLCVSVVSSSNPSPDNLGPCLLLLCVLDERTHTRRLAPLPTNKAKTVRGVLSEGLAFLDEGR